MTHHPASVANANHRTSNDHRDHANTRSLVADRNGAGAFRAIRALVKRSVRSVAGFGIAALLGAATASGATAVFDAGAVFGSDFDDGFSGILNTLQNVTSLSITGPGYLHSHGGALTAELQVFDMASGQWVTIQDVTLNNGAQFNYDGLIVAIGGLTFNQIQLLSNPGQGSSFHDWSGTLFIFTLGDAVTTLVNPFGNTMSGAQTINGSLINLGTINPGHGAPFAVQGNFTQGASGDLVIELKSKNQFGKLNVTGVATLAGGLKVQSNGGFLPEAGQKFTFLTADGGIVGAFDKLNDKSGALGTILGLDLIYGSNSVTLEFTQGSFAEFASEKNLSPNQYAVAKALDKEVAAGQSRSLIRFLDNQQLESLPNYFRRLSPEELTSIFYLGVATSQVQSANIGRRTDDIRTGSNGFSAAGLAINGDGPSFSGGMGLTTTTGVAGPTGPASAGGKECCAPQQTRMQDTRWGAFLSGTGEWVSVGDTDNARGFDLTSGGFTLGVDYKVTPNLAVGISAGYTGTTADLNDGGRVWVNGGKLGLYATYFQTEQVAPASTMSKDSSKDCPPAGATIAKGFYADLGVFGGYNSYDTRRSAVDGDARGDTDGGEISALFRVGYDFKSGGFTFGPIASFNYAYVGTSAYTEHGSLAPLEIHGGEAESIRSAFGLKASYDWKIGGVLVRPEVRASWQHEFADASYSMSSSFAGGSGNTFVVDGGRIGRDSVLLSGGVAVQFNERFSTFFYYDGELGRTNYQATAVTGGVRVAF